MDKTAIKQRYNLPMHAFWAGFFFYFGLTDSPFSRAAKIIQSKTSQEALAEDYCQLQKDLQSTLTNHMHELPTIKRNQIVDAC